MRSKQELVDILDRATERAVQIAVSKKMPLSITKKTTIIGSLFIHKNDQGFYDVCDMAKNVLYSNIIVYDVALILAQRYQDRDFSSITKILALEEKYAKHHTDMLFHLHNLKAAIRNHDYSKSLILEDKFKTSEAYAKSYKDQLFLFKRIK